MTKMVEIDQQFLVLLGSLFVFRAWAGGQGKLKVIPYSPEGRGNRARKK